MLVDARALPAGATIEADVCVVGAGPAGITLALELLGSGASVCLLESGGRDPKRPPEGRSVGYPYVPLDRTAARAFGGTSLVWAEKGNYLWHCVPLDHIDFETRQGIEHSGWPFPRRELVPYYERAARISDAIAFAYADDVHDGADLANQLAIRPGRIAVAYVQKSTSTFTRYFDRLAGAENVRLVLNATAVEILVDEAASVRRVRAVSSPGRELSVHPQVTVLAAGGIENPRLLLSSNGHRGLGNEHGLVGRFFMEHLTVPSGVVEPVGTALFAEPRLYGEGTGDGGTVRAVLRPHSEVMRREGLLNVGFLLSLRSRAATSEGARSLQTLRRSLRLEPRPSSLSRHAAKALRGIPSIIRARATPRDVFLIGIQAEQEPNPASRVTLGDRLDHYGVREPVLDWRLTDRDHASIRRAQELLDEELRWSGLGSVRRLLGEETPPSVIKGIHHHMGTTRMHRDPRHGVVDEHCRVHGVHNLFVAGSSVFPTSGWANPTFTIVALAAKLADRVREVLDSH
jgi:choline dehydrogenase-like flavoprotein